MEIELSTVPRCLACGFGHRGVVGDRGRLVWPGCHSGVSGSSSCTRRVPESPVSAQHLQSLWVLSLLAPGGMRRCRLLTIVAALGAMVWFWSYWNGHRSDLAGLFALSVVPALLISPRVVVYDWTLCSFLPLSLPPDEPICKDIWLMLGGGLSPWPRP